MSEKILKRTPLHKRSIKDGGKMVEFSGWEMPIQFSGLINEHNAVRNNGGVFDISHMGVFLIKGENVKDVMQSLVPTDLFRIGVGEACYTVLLNDSGGIIDDLIIYDIGLNENNEESLLLVINAACTDKDLKWIKNNLNEKKFSISDAKGDGLLLAVQGPKTTRILEKIFNQSLSSIPRFGHKQIYLSNPNLKDKEPIFVARTGYTGEEGFELLTTKQTGEHIWVNLIKEGIIPCGLGSRDTLRLEAAMHLYGNDMDINTTPFEAGLGWLVHLEMPNNFKGRAKLEQQAKEGIKKRLVGIKLEGRAIARKGYKLMTKEKVVGEVTSGSWSPTLGSGIAMGYLPTELSKIGTTINIEIRGKNHSGKVVKRPFYRKMP